MLTLAYKQTNKHFCKMFTTTLLLKKIIKSYLHRNKMKTELIINETVFKTNIPVFRYSGKQGEGNSWWISTC